LRRCERCLKKLKSVFDREIAGSLLISLLIPRSCVQITRTVLMRRQTCLVPRSTKAFAVYLFACVCLFPAAYMGLRQERERGPSYDALIKEFVEACQAEYGRSVLLQFEDFGNQVSYITDCIADMSLFFLTCRCLGFLRVYLPHCASRQNCPPRPHAGQAPKFQTQNPIRMRSG